MTAGRGVVHSERADPTWRTRGGVMHGIQIWLALPLDREDDPPSFAHHPKHTLPEVAPAAGVRGRVLLGAAFDARSPVVHPSEPLLVDVTLDAGAELALPEAVERAVFVIDGAIEIDGTTLPTDRLAVIRAAVSVRARAALDTRLLVLGGPSLGARFMDWNFVSSSRDKLESARDAWKAQTFPKIPGDDQEFVPYPK